MLILNARLINFPIDCFFVSCLLYLFQKVSVSASFSFGDDDCGEDEEETEEEEEAVDNDEVANKSPNLVIAPMGSTKNSNKAYLSAQKDQRR